MLTIKQDALITKAKLILSPSNSNVAENGFRVLNVTRRSPNTNRKFGKSKSLKRPPFCVALADTNCQFPSILNAIRLARAVKADLIRIARNITIFILKLINKSKHSDSSQKFRRFSVELLTKLENLGINIKGFYEILFRYDQHNYQQGLCSVKEPKPKVNLCLKKSPKS